MTALALGGQRRRRGDRRQRGDRRVRPAPVRPRRRPVRPRPPRRRGARPARHRPGRVRRRRRRAARRRSHARCRCATTSARSPCPGYVDGWLALHARFATLPADVLLAPAIDLAAHGFPASPLLVGSLARVDDAAPAQPRRAGPPGRPARRAGAPPRRRPRRCGRSPPAGATAFYGGAFGEGLLRARRRLVHAGRPAPTVGRVGHAAARRRPGASSCGPRRRARRATWRSAPPRSPTGSTCPTTPTTTAGRTCWSRRPPPSATTGPSACTTAPTAPRSVRESRGPAALVDPERASAALAAGRARRHDLPVHGRRDRAPCR